MLGEVNAALSLWDRVSKWWKGRKNPPLDAVAARFVRLFESHGVHRNQIPRFFGHGLALRDMQDEKTLTEKLNEELLDAACTKFAVRREWLDGAETKVHPFHDFYKRPESVLPFLEKLISENPSGDLHGLLLFPTDFGNNAEALLILQEVVGVVGEKSIYRFHLLNNWSPSYWKSRAYLTACVAIAWKMGVHIRGSYLPSAEIDRLRSGETLLGWRGEGIWFLGDRMWYPEDMALKPDEFLRGIEPERNNFGVRSGLELWLDLDKSGYMELGLGVKGTRDLFVARLVECSTGEHMNCQSA